MKYIIGCDVPGIEYVQHHSNGTLRCSDPSNINAKAGELIIQEYNPGIRDMTLDELDPILGSIAVMMFVAYTAGLLLKFAQQKFF